ncbi:hypothetical protein [Streptomyces sp. NPDC127084]|uniref:hypothetical protein n=1 Tax=Streptomyces sp. NPDC127084 TaxID=3347133 RepID=UPI00364EA0E7
MSRTKRGSEIRERALALVPVGEVLRADHAVGLAGRAPKPGYFRRPRALRSERRTLRSWLFLLTLGVLHLFTMTWNPIEALVEAFTERESKKPGKPFHGGWNSMAGSMAIAVIPRTKNMGFVMLQVTDRRLQLAYVSDARSLSGRPGPVEVGWATDIRNVAWVRVRSDVAAGDHEIGFVDGSWCSVSFAGQGWSRMSDAFPLRLSHLDPIPQMR